MQTIHLDKVREVVIDFAALRRIEALTGCSFLTGKEGHIRFDSLEFLLISLWAALLREDPSLTLDHVEGFLTVDKAIEADAIVGAALADCLGKATVEATESP